MNIDHLPMPDYGWGYMPPQEDIYDIFRACQSQWQPKCVLEIGFHIGHSTTYQLETYSNTTRIIGISPDNEHVGKKDNSDVISPELRRFMARTLTRKYDGRFEWIPGRTRAVLPTLVRRDFPFDFCLLDGNHSTPAALIDFEACVTLNIPRILIDNWDQLAVQAAFNQCSEYKIVQEFEYTQTFKGKTSVNKMAAAERIG